jgi:hypothetical protein
LKANAPYRSIRYMAKTTTPAVSWTLQQRVFVVLWLRTSLSLNFTENDVGTIRDTEFQASLSIYRQKM